MSNWNINDLEKWNDTIEEIVKDVGLDYFPQEFEVCDYHDMLGYQSYVGMPSRYPHWSFGKSFEKQRTLYKHGLSGLAYEMVINTNPCLAYLMIDNPLAMQVLTMAHVYGHNDFFKNNIHFSHTRPEFALEMFKRHAERIRNYVEDPSIGYEKVERILDAAHAISYQCDRNLFIKQKSVEEQKKDFYKNINQPNSEWDHLTNIEKKQQEFTPEPVADLLLYIRDNQPILAEWEKDILTIVWEETRYFLPQMETKIMNEGWASFWHFTILNKLNLPPEMHFDFIRSHNQVIRPHVGGLNPYHIGYSIFTHLAGSDGHKIDYEIDQKIFEVRNIERDTSFIRRYLTEELARKLFLFEYQAEGKKVVVSEVSDKDGWEKVRESLITNIGINGIPVIKANGVGKSRNQLLLKHEFDGRELQLKYTEKTLAYVYELWNNPVELETTLENESICCTYNESGFKIQK